MNASVRKFLKEEDGVTALEYGLLAAVIAGILIAVGNDQIKGFFETLYNTPPAVPPTGPGSTTSAAPAGRLEARGHGGRNQVKTVQ